MRENRTRKLSVLRNKYGEDRGPSVTVDDMDAAPAWVLNRAKAYLENDMVSLTFLHISMNYSKNV